MIDRIRKMRYEQFVWFSVLNYILHFAEEVPRFVDWMHGREGKLAKGYTQRKFNTENALMFSFAVMLTAMLNLKPRSRFLRTVSLGSGVAYLENTVFHALPTLKEGVYSPGVITSCLFNPAYAFILYWKARQEGFLDRRMVVGSILAGTFVLPSFVWFTHGVLLKDDKPAGEPEE